MGVARLDVSNKQWLYVSGCSHLAGSEVVEQGNTARTNEAVGLVWPGLLAKEYELNYINQCMPGASNDYIKTGKVLTLKIGLKPYNYIIPTLTSE